MKNSCYFLGPATEAVWSYQDWQRYREIVCENWTEKDEETQKKHLAVLVGYAQEAVVSE